MVIPSRSDQRLSYSADHKRASRHRSASALLVCTKWSCQTSTVEQVGAPMIHSSAVQQYRQCRDGGETWIWITDKRQGEFRMVLVSTRRTFGIATAWYLSCEAQLLCCQLSEDGHIKMAIARERSFEPVDINQRHGFTDKLAHMRCFPLEPFDFQLTHLFSVRSLA